MHLVTRFVVECHFDTKCAYSAVYCCCATSVPGRGKVQAHDLTIALVLMF